jgi:hypothetical protein
MRGDQLGLRAPTSGGETRRDERDARDATTSRER